MIYKIFIKKNIFKTLKNNALKMLITLALIVK